MQKDSHGSGALVTVRISYAPGSHGPHCRRHRCHHVHCDDNRGVHADAAAEAAAAPHPEGARRAVDERNCRKINVFNGTGWKDFSLQFKAATRSSHKVAFDLLCWAELEQSDIDPQSYTELHVESTQRVPGELFNVLTTSLENRCRCCTTATSTVWRLGGACQSGTRQQHR